jgi:hypothetical protein
LQDSKWKFYGLYEIEKEDYMTFLTALEELMKILCDFNSIVIDDNEYEIEKYLGMLI